MIEAKEFLQLFKKLRYWRYKEDNMQNEKIKPNDTEAIILLSYPTDMYTY